MVWILALAGKRYTGKTYAGNYIASRAPFKKIAFADAPKAMFIEKYRLASDALTNPDKKEEYRKDFIDYCMEKRDREPFLFVKKFIEQAANFDLVVCDDMRFDTELMMAQRLGICAKIVASDEVRMDNGWVPNPAVDEHRSETDLDFLPDEYWIQQGAGLIPNPGKKLSEYFQRTLDEVITMSLTFRKELYTWFNTIERANNQVRIITPGSRFPQ